MKLTVLTIAAAIGAASLTAKAVPVPVEVEQSIISSGRLEERSNWLAWAKPPDEWIPLSKGQELIKSDDFKTGRLLHTNKLMHDLTSEDTLWNRILQRKTRAGNKLSGGMLPGQFRFEGRVKPMKANSFKRPPIKEGEEEVEPRVKKPVPSDYPLTPVEIFKQIRAGPSFAELPIKTASRAGASVKAKLSQVSPHDLILPHPDLPRIRTSNAPPAKTPASGAPTTNARQAKTARAHGSSRSKRGAARFGKWLVGGSRR